jgi:hypothetical protein
MPLNIYRKNMPSTLVRLIISVYNKYRQNKTRRSLAGPQRGNEIELSPNSA